MCLILCIRCLELRLLAVGEMLRSEYLTLHEEPVVSLPCEAYREHTRTSLGFRITRCTSSLGFHHENRDNSTILQRVSVSQCGI